VSYAEKKLNSPWFSRLKDFIWFNSLVTLSSPRPLDEGTKGAFVQGWSHSEVKYSQIPAGKC